MSSTAPKHAAQYVVDAAQCGRTVHTTCCSHDDTMNGPDTEAVDEVKALILKSVNTWKNYCQLREVGVIKGQRPSDEECLLSQLLGLEDVVFNDFIKDDFIPEGRGQVASAVRFCIPS